MSGFPSYLSVLPFPGHGLVVCRHHGYCVLPSSVLQHLNNKHPDLGSAADRRQIQAYIDDMSDQLHQEYSDVIVPQEPCPAIEGLEVHRGSLACLTEGCAYIAAGKERERNMKQHLRTKHDIRAAGMGSAHPAGREAWWRRNWEVVTSQRFFLRAGADQDGTERGPASHFPVFYPDDIDTSATASPISFSAVTGEELARSTATPSGLLSPTTELLEALTANYLTGQKEADAALAASHSLVPAAPTRQTSPYLEHTRFQECIEGMAWAEVRGYARPTPSRQLRHLEDTIKSMVLVYQHTVARTSRWARLRVMQEHYQHVPTMPLFHYQDFKLKHSSTLVQIFTFFHQVCIRNLPPPPTFHLTPAQQRAWDNITHYLEECDDNYPAIDLAHTRTKLEPFEAMCHQFWLSLLEQTTVESDFALAIVTPLAFIAVDPKIDGFRAAYNFATDLSAIKKLARFAGCQRLWDTIKPDAEAALASITAVEPAGEEGTQPAEVALLCREQQEAERNRDAMVETCYQNANDQFRDWIYRYLTSEYSTPMGWVITTAHYIGKFRYGQTLDAFVHWNGPTITVRNLSTTFDKFRGMVWAVHDELERMLLQLTFSDKMEDLPAIPWNSLVDDPCNHDPGYSPFSPSNKALAGRKNFVLEQMKQRIRSKQNADLVITRFNDFEQVKRYGQLVERFKDLLFFHQLVTSGSGGRLTEYLTVQHENTVSNGIRNLFLFQGHVAIAPSYHKGYNRDKSLKMIFRFPPRAVSRMLIWYLWLVRPFLVVATQQQQHADAQTSHYHQSRSSFLWSNSTGEAYKNSDRFANLVRRYTETYLGTKAGPNLFRHLHIGLVRNRDDSKGQRLLKLSPEEADEILDEFMDDANEVQAGHTVATAKAVYALETAQVFTTRFTNPEAHLRSSKQWSARLGFDDDDVAGWFGALDRNVTPKTTATAKLAERLLARENVCARDLLRGNLGKTATFRGKQQAVVEHVLDAEPVVSYIAGTSSGKSLAFLLPACCEDFGQQIVITPLVALGIDIGRECSQLSITNSVWGSQGYNETARIVFASPEHLNRPDFQKMVTRRWNMGQLERIVLDEYHYVLLPDDEYRPGLLALRDIVQYRVPITLLSATIPPIEESEAHRRLGLDGHVQVFRQSTSRPNIRYEVETLRRKGEDNISAAEIGAYLAKEQRQHAKILVYVASKALARDLSDQTADSKPYCADMPMAERATVQAWFKKCSSGVLFATACFNAGVNIPDITLVLCLGCPDHVITWSQGSGRGGRNGKPSVARIVLGPGLPSFFEKLENQQAYAVLEKVVAGQCCFRIPWDEYLDGDKKRTGCTAQEEPCSFCQRYSTPDTIVAADTIHSLSETSVAAGTPVRGSSLSASLSSPAQSSMVPATYTPGSFTDGHLRTGPEQSSVYSQSPYALSVVDESPTHMPTPSYTQRQQGRIVQTHGSTGSPVKRHRRQVSDHDKALTDCSESSRVGIKAARITRELSYHREAWLGQTMAGAELLFDALPRTAEYWIHHCIKCFVDRVEFDHTRASCKAQIGSLVTKYRGQYMENNLGRPMCYSCVMPMLLCAKWLQEDGTLRRSPDRSSTCTYPKFVLDTWACLWEYAPKAKAIWLERIDDNSGGLLKGEERKDFALYFRQMIQFGSQKTVNQITLDVHWFTVKYFLCSGKKWKELLEPGGA